MFSPLRYSPAPPPCLTARDPRIPVVFDLLTRPSPLVYCTFVLCPGSIAKQSDVTGRPPEPVAKPTTVSQRVHTGAALGSEDHSPTSRAHTRSPYSGTQYRLHTLPTCAHATLALWLTNTDSLSDKLWSYQTSV